MDNHSNKDQINVTREQLITLLNEDLARELLSFDENIKALASVLEIAVFPPLKEQGIERRAQLAKR